MKRITIEITDQQQQRLTVMAALQGQSVNEYVLASALGDGEPTAALEEFEQLLEQRLASARAGGVSTRSVGEIFQAAFRETDAGPANG